MVSSQSTNQVRFIWLETDLLFLLRWWRSWMHQEWRGKIAINLHEKMEKWKLNRDSRCFDPFVTTLPLFLDKVTFRVISTSISPQEIWLLIPRRNSQARNSEFWRKILTFSSGLLLFYFLFFFANNWREKFARLAKLFVAHWKSLTRPTCVSIVPDILPRLGSFPWITDFEENRDSPVI